MKTAYLAIEKVINSGIKFFEKIIEKMKIMVKQFQIVGVVPILNVYASEKECWIVEFVIKSDGESALPIEPMCL
jgi:hypothetical protein